MFESVTEELLFPTFLWVHDLEPALAERLNRQLFHDLDKMTAPRPALQPGQNWQTQQDLHTFAEMRELVGVVEAAVAGVLGRMELAYEDFVITGCWANINPRGAPHPPHFHSNNFLSGVYYVQVTPSADSITFHEPRTQVDVVAPLVERPNKYTSPHHHIPVRPGRLVLFPSWLTHSVRRNDSDALRISVSFNFMFRDFVEKLSPPRWKGIPVRSLSGPAGGGS